MIKIQTRNWISDYDAISAVRRVILDWKISWKENEYYCYCSILQIDWKEIRIFTKQTKNKNIASFIVE